jgi:hypothetical protein
MYILSKLLNKLTISWNKVEAAVSFTSGLLFVIIKTCTNNLKILSTNYTLTVLKIPSTNADILGINNSVIR